jgi:hypothetical protein
MQRGRFRDIKMLTERAVDFVHPELNKTVKAIGGEYLFLKEAILSYRDQEVLYLVGCAIFDTTCCGTGGCCYARVPGFIRDAKYRTVQDGRPVSSVVPIADPRAQKEIRRVIGSRETVQQVEF